MVLLQTELKELSSLILKEGSNWGTFTQVNQFNGINLVTSANRISTLC